MIFCFAPLLLSKILVPRRIVLSAAFLCTCTILIMAWSLHNYLRYDDFTLSRGASACIPLYRLWTVNKVVHPYNGPVSMELGVAVRKDLLRREPYVSYGISEERFFSSGSTRMWSDLVSLSDRTWGWSDNYRHLRLVAMEALRQHWIPYARELILNYYNIMMMPGDVPHSVLRNSPQGKSP